MRSREEDVLVIQRNTVDIPVIIKTFRFFLTSDLDQLADDANENHNCVACLFTFQTARSDSSFYYLD